MRTRYAICRHCGDLHAYNAWPHNCMDEPWPRSDHPAPYIVNDNLPGGIHGMMSHADGRIYDSKHAYYDSVRRAGCEIVADDPGYRPEALAEREQRRVAESEKAHEREIQDAYIQARDTLTSDNISNDEMHNMLRAQVPAEEIIPSG